MIDSKWMKTMEVFESYERRFAELRARKKESFPLDDASREEIITRVKKLLAYREELVPTVHDFTELKRQDMGSYDMIRCRYETWEKCYVTASLYMPHGEDKLPLAFVFCGHANEGSLGEAYRRMCHRFAENGYAVICPDNIGQGDRTMMGHRDAFATFYCGLTLQGLILMESVALIRYMQKHPRVDASRMASCGNSGGGTLNVFLAALAPELSAIAATGYPSEFHYIMAKERRHCSCNLLPGCLSVGPEMWEILSTFAPKPLLIEQGQMDHLIPFDYFMRTARKVSFVYRAKDAEDHFRAVSTNEGHSWAAADIKAILTFISGALHMPDVISEEDPASLYDFKEWVIPMPEDALNTTQLSEKLSGIKSPEGLTLQDVFPPTCSGERIDPDTVITDVGRGDLMRVWAQMESALRED